MSFTGQCLCGSVKYECSAEPVFSGKCHCNDCQKASGSAFSAVIAVPESTISIQGEVKFFESIGGSGKKTRRGFCPVCGSMLFGKPESLPGLIVVHAGSLDDTSKFHPQMDIFVSRAAPWDFIHPSANSFPEMPPNPNA